MCIQPPDVAVGAVRPELHSAAQMEDRARWVHAAVEVVVCPVRLESAMQSAQVGVEVGSLAVNAVLVDVGEVACCDLQLRLSEHAYCGVLASLARLHRFSDAFELIYVLLIKPALFRRESAVRTRHRSNMCQAQHQRGQKIM